MVSVTLDRYELADRYCRTGGRVYLTGTQALVRVLVKQARRDHAEGLETTGFVSGYRGSPLGGVDFELWRAKDLLARESDRVPAGRQRGSCRRRDPRLAAGRDPGRPDGPGRVRPLLTLEPELVLEAARSADKARAAGQATGLLYGLPIPVKDSVDTKGLPTSNGTRSMRGFRPKDDATLVKRLLANVVIVMGKTNMTELSFGWDSNNGTFGPVRNPYDRDRIPGGSSGGSAAAVAARAAPIAIAADTLGSIRVPATLCGIAGLRPTFGRYPDDGIFSLTANMFDQTGLLPAARQTSPCSMPR